MAIKRVEIDFTQSGTLQIDLMGNLNINLNQLTVSSHVKPLPGFLVRPGRRVTGQGTGTQQNLPTTSGIYQFYDLTHPQKSMVIWYYNLPGTDNNAGLWVQTSASSTQHGWQFNVPSNQLYFRLNSALTFPATPSGALATSGWKMAAVTIDRAVSGINLYHNGNLVTTVTGIATDPATNATPIGVDRAGNNAIYFLSTIQVYSGVLTSGEINQLYNAFLPDTITNAPFITMTGTLLSDQLNLVTDGRTVAYHHNTNEIHSIYNSVSGEYRAYLPTSGSYTIFSTSPTFSGGNAIPAVVTSSGVVTFYDL